MSRAPRVAFVTGATGYTGRAVVSQLTKIGVDVIAHVRPDSPALSRWREEFSRQGARVDETPWERAAMAETLTRRAVTEVYFLIGTTARRSAAARRDPKAAPSDYEHVDFGLAALLIDACVDAGTAPRFVYLSSIGASPRGNAYLRARARIEEKLRAGALPYVVARPSFITGPDREERRPLERVTAAITDGLFGLVGARRLRARYGSIDAEGLAAALVRLAVDPDAAGAIVDAEGLRG